MKLFRILAILSFLSISILATAQDKVAYQALLLDDSGPIISRNVEVWLGVSFGNLESRTSLYKERHTTQTDGSGLVSLVLGGGAVQNGTWSLINWSRDDLYLETYLLEGSSQKLISISKINATPKALYANQALSVASNSINSIHLQDGSITSEKLDNSVIQQISTLAVSEIQNQLSTNLNTVSAYQAGSGVQIINDTIQVSHEVVLYEVPGVISVNAIAAKNDESASWTPDFSNYASPSDLFQDYSFYLGKNELFSFQIVEQFLSKSLFSDEIGTNELEIVNQDQSRSIKLMPQIQNDQLDLVVTADLIAQRFKGDGSQLTNLPPSVIDTTAYQPIRGFYFQKPTLDFYSSFQTDIEQNLLNATALSNSGLSELSNFAEGYLENPSNDFPLLLGQVGDSLNPKGVVFSTAVSSKVIRAGNLKTQEAQISDLVTAAIHTPLQQEVIGVTTDGGVESVKVTADQFIGDGSALTGINSVDLDEWNSAKGFYSIKSSSTIEPRIEVIMDSITNGSQPIYDHLNYYLGPIESDDNTNGVIDEELGERLGYLATNRIDAGFLFSINGYIDDFSASEIYTDDLVLDNSLNVIGYGDVIYYDPDDDLVVKADRFIGDGSGLTGISTSIGTGAIESLQIRDATITNVDVSSTAAIDFSKLNISKANIESLGINSIESINDLPNTYGIDANILIDADGSIDTSAFSNPTKNIGIGGQVFQGLTSGYENVSLGRSNLSKLQSGFNNIAIGNVNMRKLTIGVYNAAFGYMALNNLNSSTPAEASYNLGLGFGSGSGITKGAYNIALGYNSLTPNNPTTYEYTGNNNIGIGFYSGTVSDKNYTGSDGVFIGSYAAPQSADSSENIAIGYQALAEMRAVSIGSRSISNKLEAVALGPNALSQGSYSLALGSKAEANAAYSIAIGYSATAINPNVLQLGDISSETGIKVITNTNADASFKTISPSSDKRLKRNIAAISDGMSIVSALNPVKYEKKGSLKATEYDTKEYGFVAQEVQDVLPDLIKDLGGDDHILTLNYNGLIAILTKALQEQNTEIELLKEQVKLLMADRQ